MDIHVHNRLLWHGCVNAAKRLKSLDSIGDPRAYFPFLVRGSWANDVNQATLFADKLPDTKNNPPDEGIQRFFNALWKQEKHSLLKDMKVGNPEAVEVYDEAKKISETEESMPSHFGNYTYMDHFDINENRPDIEYTGNGNQYKVAKTIKDVKVLHIPGRITHSTYDKKPEERLHYHNLTSLGRGLHTCQDFYAHSNYTELLLWHMAWNKELDSDIIYGFNEPSRFLIDTLYEETYCPLPTRKEDIEMLTRKNTIMWYGESPQATPLVSCLFDNRDLAYSLISLLINHLESESEESNGEANLDLLLSIFGLPAKPLINTIRNVYEPITNFFDKAGKRIRKFLVDTIMEDPRVRNNPIAQSFKAIMETYESAEAKDWARAGKFKYIVHSLKQNMSKELANQSITKPQLPHHSLIHKDYISYKPEDALRFRISALFAVRITEEILVQHFSKIPSEEKIDTLLEKHMMHPSEQLDKNIVDKNMLKSYIQKGYGARWSRIAKDNPIK